MNITYDKTASQTVRFAASELADYLTRMLGGQTLPIHLSVSDDGANCLDGFSVEMTAEGGTITGVNDRSVLLAVYDYLRRLGCRFLAPGRDCEVVPVISAGALSASYQKRASFRHRGVCIEGADSLENIRDFIDWLPKVGYNSFFLQFKTPYAFLSRWYHHERNPWLSPEDYTPADAARDGEVLEAEVKKRGLLLHKVGHGWTGETLGYESLSWRANSQPLSPEKQPWAAELGGARELFQGIPTNTNLCYHNGQAMDAFASLVVDYAKAHPAVDYLHIWLADAYNNVCECADCQKTTLSDQYVSLLNEIDRRLTVEGLDTRLVFLLYQELLWPPVKERLVHPDRFVLMFAPISRTFETSYQVADTLPPIPPYVRNHITLPTSLAENLAFLRGWQAQFQGDSFIYDYPLGRAHYGDFGYTHMARIVSQDIKQLKKLGLDGYISCQELRVCLPNALPNYVMGHTLWDETANVEELIQEYFTAAYGSDASAVQTYLDTLSHLSSRDYVNGKGPREDPEMAARMAEIICRCEDFAPVLAAHLQGLFWHLLAYHRRYIIALAKALGALAAGEQETAFTLWRELRDLIGQNEMDYQPYLDVYRVLEVTANYTGFSGADT